MSSPHDASAMSARRLREILSGIERARIGVVGDFCVDSYYMIDSAASERSLETGVMTRPVHEHRTSLGGAGNVVANLRALGVATVKAFAVVGPDALGWELLRLLGVLQVDAAGVITQPTGWQTHSYLKPIVNGEECHRYDFGLFNTLSASSAEAVLAAIEAALPGLDVLVINQQFKKGIHSAAFRTGLDQLLRRHPRVIALVDGRDLDHDYPTGLRKLNDLEATRLCGAAHVPNDDIPREEVIAAMGRLYTQWQRPVFVTRGRFGSAVIDAQGVHEIRGLHLIGKIDSVGAGDSFVAGVAACLAIATAPAEAATFGNFVAGVTVQKLQQTGTASPTEILAIGESPDYVYAPELAGDMRRATYVSGTDIELAEPLPADFNLRFAIFDHDGTLSTLRQGWESVMEPMMIQAILGPAAATVDRATYDRVIRQVREFIDQTTGVQTLKQMHGLALMVREAGFVPEAEVLDAAGYKRIYNAALMDLVAQRKAWLQRGELDVADFTLKNASALLHRLKEAGVRLYLASGTDEQDVVLEAEALGYAALFEGRIYGANHDMTHDAKRMILDRILGEIGTENAGHIVTFGDGPVEIRETRKRGGLTVGVASNELQRFGLQPEKRTRVIRAGAHLVVSDYAQLEALLGALRLGDKAKA